MGLLNTILGNEKLVNSMLGTLGKQMRDNKTKYVVLSLKEDNTFDIQMLQEDDKPVVYSQGTVDEMIAQFNDFTTTIEALRELNRVAGEQYKELYGSNQVLISICKEQEKAINSKTKANDNEYADAATGE